MRASSILLLAVFVGTAVTAQADVIDNFSCSNTDSLTGASGFHATFVSCPGSIGGEREDFIDVAGGSSTSVSTMASNPPVGAISGTFGSGITGIEGMNWGNPTILPDLNLVGNSILVQIQSDSGGSVTIDLLSGTSPSLLNSLAFTATFAGSPSYQDLLIPLINPTVIGTGANLAEVTDINMYIGLDTPGGTWSVDAVDAVPEPSAIWLIGICLLGMVSRSFWRRPTS